MIFLCIYFGEGRGGGALMHVYIWEHIVSLYYRTAELLFTKLGRDEVLMAPHMHSGVSARSTQGRSGLFVKNCESSEMIFHLPPATLQA